jgi:hypothetical protein
MIWERHQDLPSKYASVDADLAARRSAADRRRGESVKP